jgi:NAD(P)-dependent dehydrogenase (short-subunit alcohol dehydrogenase family)
MPSPSALSQAPPTQLLVGKVALITGGTRGIGLATALALAGQGAMCVLTYRWGSADEDEICKQFRDIGALEPLLLQADIGLSEDTVALLDQIKDKLSRVDIFISNASVALLVKDLSDYTERGFLKSLRNSAWPTFDYLTRIKTIFGVMPKHVVIMSSDGPDRFTPFYDFVAASKAVIETLTRYLAYRLRDEQVCINVLRSRAIRTESFDDTFGNEFYDFLGRLVPPQWFMSPAEVADAALALCSGMFDGMSGQVVMVDNGNTFSDGISSIYQRQQEQHAKPSEPKE